MWISLLSVLIVVSAALTISAEYHGPKRHVYLFKPLTVILIILLAFMPKYPVAPFYRYMIVAGLVCSLVGDMFLMLPSNRFIQGLLSFLVAHIFYIAAFAFSGERTLSKWAALPLLIYGVVMVCWLWSFLGKMKAPVIIYMLVILLMAWMALSRYLETGVSGSFLAALGSIFFLASDSILAVNKFKSGFRSAQLHILITYFMAQWLIALST
ncbi:MAG: lysoplasmalogenase [Pyrinomonadaceae bacterium]|nr:lysoplasmalogenase [Pyrinomonadaceae bacterium]